jgi:hypothetical protein
MHRKQRAHSSSSFVAPWLVEILPIDQHGGQKHTKNSDDCVAPHYCSDLPSSHGCLWRSTTTMCEKKRVTKRELSCRGDDEIDANNANRPAVRDNVIGVVAVAVAVAVTRRD